MHSTTLSSPSTTTTNAPTLSLARVSGLLYVSASIGFLIVFSWLARNFGYPDVLERPAAEVLPRLSALGNDGRAVWIVYALLPLMLVPAAIGASNVLGIADRRNRVVLQLGVVLQSLAALCMAFGLARWSTAQWALADAWPHADAGQRLVLTALFDALNLYLGNGIGEFGGELLLYGSFAAFAVALNRGGSRMVAALGAATALSGWVAMFRNITPTVQLASDVSNLLLPLFLIVFGVALVRTKRSSRHG